MQIQNLHVKGSFSFDGATSDDATSKWVVPENSSTMNIILPYNDSQEFMVKNAKDNDGNQLEIATLPMYVIPDITTDIKLQFTITAYVGEDRTTPVFSRTLVGTLETPGWQQGYSYIYNIKLNGNTTDMNVISFTASVNDFGEVNDSKEPTFTNFTEKTGNSN